MDATEILKSNAAAAAAADAAWVNPRDPAKAVGADGLPVVPVDLRAQVVLLVHDWLKDRLKWS